MTTILVNYVKINQIIYALYAVILILIVKDANLTQHLNNECVWNVINLLNLNIFHFRIIVVYMLVINVFFYY